jgi:hypothetical protein
MIPFFPANRHTRPIPRPAAASFFKSGQPQVASGAPQRIGFPLSGLPSTTRLRAGAGFGSFFRFPRGNCCPAGLGKMVARASACESTPRPARRRRACWLLTKTKAAPPRNQSVARPARASIRAFDVRPLLPNGSTAGGHGRFVFSSPVSAGGRLRSAWVPTRIKSHRHGTEASMKTLRGDPALFPVNPFTCFHLIPSGFICLRRRTDSPIGEAQLRPGKTCASFYRPPPRARRWHRAWSTFPRNFSMRFLPVPL